MTDLTWRATLELFGRFGRPPSFAEIGKEIGLIPEQTRTLMLELQAHDLLGTDDTTGEIVYAYPFTKRTTEHCVELYGRNLNALCAIDTLGVGGMFRVDVTIESCCRYCGSCIEV